MNGRYCNAVNGNEKQFPTLLPSQKLLSDLEWNEIITQIYIQWIQNDCLKWEKIQLLAINVFKHRTSKEKPLSLNWLMDFRNHRRNFIQKLL